MTIGQIKLEALMLMYPEIRLPADRDLASETITYLSEGSLYCDLIASMDQSITRALFYIELWGLTKTKRVTSKISREEPFEYYLPLPSDAFLVNQVIARTSEGNVSISFAILDNEICVLEKASEYIIEYREKGILVDGATPPTTELSLASQVEVIIPYFIKGELYRESPKEAQLCQERFFSALDKLSSIEKNRTECRISPYKIV